MRMSTLVRKKAILNTKHYLGVKANLNDISYINDV